MSERKKSRSSRALDHPARSLNGGYCVDSRCRYDVFNAFRKDNVVTLRLITPLASIVVVCLTQSAMAQAPPAASGGAGTKAQAETQSQGETAQSAAQPSPRKTPQQGTDSAPEAQGQPSGGSAQGQDGTGQAVENAPAPASSSAAQGQAQGGAPRANAPAQPQSEAQTAPSQGAAPRQAQPSAAAEATGPSLGERQRRAMDLYRSGDSGQALYLLESLQSQCVQMGETACSQRQEATLFRDIGIVQAEEDEEAAVRAFSRALELDPTVRVGSSFATDEVMEAFEEAEEDQQGDSSWSDEGEALGFILLEGTAKYGTLYTERDPNGYQEFDSTGQLGGAFTLGMNPGGGGFTIAGRGRGGAYLGNDADLGFVGGSVLFGGVLGADRKSGSFGYVMGGAGVEFIPETPSDGVTFHGMGGAVMRGIAFGGGVDFMLAGDNYSIVFGLHIGWGHLL